LAGTGVGATFNLGKKNTVNAISKLVGSTASSMLLVDNNGAGTALDLKVGPATTPAADKTVAPMKVDSQAKVANLNSDELDGKDFSAFNATKIYDGTGPLALEGTTSTGGGFYYTSKGGTLIILVSGSAFRDTLHEGRIGLSVRLDGATSPTLPIGKILGFTNELSSHKAMSGQIVYPTNAGEHTIKLEAIRDPSCNTSEETPDSYCTTTDGNDFFKVTVIEIPRF